MRASVSVVGTFRPNPRGFGFLTLTEPVRSFSGSVDSAFVPPPIAERLLEGDVVSASVELDRRGATVVDFELMSRPRRLLAGVVVRWGRGLALRPDSSLGTKDRRLPDRFPAKPGDAVVVAIRPDNGSSRWQVASLVAGPMAASSPQYAKALASVRAFGTYVTADDTEHTADVLASDLMALVCGTDASYPAVPAPAGVVGRRDATSDPAFTVDSASTRDLDDAVCARRVSGGVRVDVHIADVAVSVPSGSALDMAARARGTSVYMLGRTLPMLPPELSEGALSLLPGVDRATVCVSFTVSTEGGDVGAVSDVEVHRAKIRSAARLTYDDVSRFLEDGRLSASDDVADSVAAAAAAADALGAARCGRDTLEGEATSGGRPRLFEPPRFELELVDGQPTPMPFDPDAPAQLMVERLMVAANEAVASWLLSAGASAIYRTHPGVDSDAIGDLEAASGSTFAGTPSAADIVAALSGLEGSDADRFATVVASSMARAAYVAQPGHHFGLDSHPYTHFTSPIRRYADLVVHRVVASVLDGTPAPYSDQELERICGHLNVRMSAAARAESMEKAMLWTTVLTSSHRHLVTEATVVRLTPRGASVRLPDVGVTAFVPAAEFGDDYFVDPDGLAAFGFRRDVTVGERLAVTAPSSDAPLGRLELRLAA